MVVLEERGYVAAAPLSRNPI